MLRRLLGIVGIFSILTLCFTALPAAPLAAQADAGDDAELALLRVMHAIPDAPEVDIYLDGRLILQDLAYFSISRYLVVPAGEQRIQVVPAGLGVAAAVIDLTPELFAGSSHTIGAIGNRANAEALAIKRPIRQFLSDNAHVLLVHAATEAPTFDITAPGYDQPFAEDLAFGDSVELLVPPGVYRFELVPPGADTPFYTAEAVRLEGGWGYTLVVTDYPGQAQSIHVQSRVDYVPESGYVMTTLPAPQGGRIYAASLAPLNQSVNIQPATGYATVTESADAVTFTTFATGVAPEMMHVQHYHGFTDEHAARCPTLDDDLNGDNIIDFSEALAVAGQVLVPLHADPLTLEHERASYPAANSNGFLDYQVTVDRDELEAALERNYDIENPDYATGLVMIHGVSPETPLPDTVQSSADMSAQMTLPVACGTYQRAP
ncbi:MAG: DUF4397 domain-containing protein [Oscillochloris sp.]|nr:DUF4397 domain-containing protein [Oscillochloris sp.]